MIEVFKDDMHKDNKIDIEDIDEEIRKETLRYRCTQLETLGLSLLSGVMLVVNKGNTLTRLNKLILCMILVICTMFFFYARVHYKKRVRKIIIENKTMIRSSKEVSLTREYVYINNVLPLKMKI